MKTPTTIVTGFLGSGKTTIINGLIEYLQNQGKKVAYVKNEIGDTDLDAKLMIGKNIKAKELLGGCICCTLVGPFINSINELIDTYHPDRIIVETAGTADPAAMVLMVEDHPRLSRDALLAIIDVANFEGYKDLTQSAKRQAEMTDLIIFNKIELADLEQKKRVVSYVRELNEYSPIVEAPKGRINPNLAFGVDVGDLNILKAEKLRAQSHEHEHDDQITAFTFRTNQNFDSSCLEKLILELPKTVFRVKGMIKVNNSWKVFNAAYKRAEITDLEFTQDKLPEKSYLIVIGFQIEKRKEEVTGMLEKCLI